LVEGYGQIENSDLSLKAALDRARKNVPISTGSEALDSLLNGGYLPGQLVEVFGDSNTGKTQLALQASVIGAAHKFKVVFIDTESTFRPERIAQIATLRGYASEELLASIYAIRAYSTTKQLDSVFAVARRPDSRDCKLVIVDTLTKNFSLDYAGTKRTIYRQQQLNVYLNTLARDAYLNGRAVLLTNRVATIGVNGRSREVDIGGGTVRHLVHKSVHLVRAGHEIRAVLDSDGRNRSVTFTLTEEGIV
jgi:RecA/RadA recombinase